MVPEPAFGDVDEVVTVDDEDLTGVDLSPSSDDLATQRRALDCYETYQKIIRSMDPASLYDGGVHSHLDHLVALLDLAKREGLARDQVVVHAFTDGRDTDPHGGVGYAKTFKERAREIGVVLEQGGRRLIEVSDDGCGMSEEDALLALERHATSKIVDFDDLTRPGRNPFWLTDRVGELVGSLDVFGAKT